jgi:hypothetical protein
MNTFCVYVEKTSTPTHARIYSHNNISNISYNIIIMSNYVKILIIQIKKFTRKEFNILTYLYSLILHIIYTMSLCTPTNNRFSD